MVEGAFQRVRCLYQLARLPSQFLHASAQVADVDLDVVYHNRGSQPACFGGMQTVLLPRSLYRQCLDAPRDGAQLARSSRAASSGGSQASNGMR